MTKRQRNRYCRIHYWVKKRLGYPKECEDCGKIGKYSSNNRWTIEWSNIDHKYKKTLGDYIGRCSMCHKIYDKNYDFSDER